MLVETKLFLPRPRESTVPRPRLSERLVLNRDLRLTLLSAPAGFGKTTLLADWLHADGATQNERPDSGHDSGRGIAWVSLEEDDSDPVRFWTYLATAVQRATGRHEGNALAVLTSRQPSIEGFLTTFLNELVALEEDLALVLDDFHLVDGPMIQPGVVFLLDHLPPNVHLIISSRTDPALPLARLRARGQLAEIRAADLRFSEREATAYLNDVLDLNLSKGDVAALGERTEGWAAALQLAALSLQGHRDPSGFIASFAGDDRYIVDYLVEEVLDQQPAAVRDFLLQTSILDRLSGALCDTVTGTSGGEGLLVSLDRANLFLVALDDTRRWYRYHHLFADLLQARLRDEHPDLLPSLHARACAWYDEAGQPVPAVRHAVASGDMERAADLAELAIPELRRNRQEATISSWASLLPDAVVATRPVLAVGLISGLMSAGQFTGLEDRISAVAPLLPTDHVDSTTPPPPGAVVVDHTEWERLPGELTMYRAALALTQGDPAAAIELADAAMSQAAPDDHLTHAGAAAIAGLARWGNGDLEAAHGAYSSCVHSLQRANHIPDVLGCCLTLADIRITQGRLTDAQRTYENALELAAREPGSVLRGTADMYAGLSQVAWKRNDLATATHYLQLSDDLGEHSGLPQHPWRSRVAHAQLRYAAGDLAAASLLMAEAERVYVSDFLPEVRPIPALRARLDVARGDLASARDWVRSHDLSADDDLTYLRECEHITLARVLLAEHAQSRAVGAWHDVTRLLDRLQAATEEGGRTGNLLEVLVLQALAHQVREKTRAQTTLRRALSLAESEGHLRVFLDDGAALAPLLLDIVRGAESQAQQAQLVLDASARAPHRGASATDSDQTRLLEPLSDRELDVLRLLGSDLDGPSIAGELSVSLSTVRTHTQHIYVKLAVSNRRAAVRKAAELGLLRPAASH